MEPDEFWAIVGTRRIDDDFAALVDELAAREAATIIAFEERLAEVLHAIDTPAHADAARSGNDWFLYMRCAAVAAGREAYGVVLAEPAKLRRFARKEAELLLSVASEAYERSTGRLWEHETALSYESGSNTAAWGVGPPHPVMPLEEDGSAAWLTLSVLVSRPGGYGPAADYVADAIGRNPEWRDWWLPSGLTECRLMLVEAELGGVSSVKLGETRIEAQAVASEGGTSQAIPDITRLLEGVRARLSLATLPPLPELPDELPPRWGEDQSLEPMGLLRAIGMIFRARRARRHKRAACTVR